MASDSSQGSSFSIPQEISSCPSIGSVLDGYMACRLSSFNGNLEGEPCFEMIKAVIGDIIGAEEAVVDDDVLDRLPMDPFEMNMESTLTTFSDWIEDIKGRGLSHVGYRVSSSEAYKCQNCTKIECDAQGAPPHDALFFVLGYLRLRDLLSIEQVCRSLRDSVRGDPLLWRTVSIDKPLNEKIRDDTLVKLTNRAQGTLQCLTLVNCLWITDGGLGCVLQSNPKLMKLSVPDCIRLTIEGILFNLRALRSLGTPGLKHLKIGGLAGVCRVTEQQFEELKELLGASMHLQQGDQKPRFFHGGYSHILCEDGRAIDIEVCPRCQKLRPVYDCPAESCQQKHQAAQLCRGCTICIARCFHCGRCIKDFDYEETFCLDLLCLNCWNQFLLKREKEATKCTIIKGAMYQLCLYG